MQKAVDFYNQKKDEKRKDRLNDPLLCLKRFHNFIKASLIQNFSAPRLKIVDLACGKGGDLMKWKRMDPLSYLGIDPAENSIAQAKERCTEIDAHFPQFQFRVESFAELSPMGQGDVDVISCQFALHYAFASERDADHVFAQVSQALKPGGVFMGIVPDASAVLSRANKDHPLMKIVMALIPTEKKFGQEYFFTLPGAVEACPEYLVHEEHLQKLGEKHGLQWNVSKSINIQTYYHMHKKNLGLLAKNFQFLNAQGRYSSEEWDVSGVFRIFYFIKQ
jgi:mRNA (guanine-N7-)-methyltransferase